MSTSYNIASMSIRSDWLVKITFKILFCDWLTGDLKTKGEQ